MRVLVLAKEGERSDAATPPTPEAMAEHQKFNEELVKAGVVVAAGRLAPSGEGKRVRFDGKKRTVIDGRGPRMAQAGTLRRRDLRDPAGLHARGRVKRIAP